MKKVYLALLLFAVAGTAQAHHPLGGLPMQTFGHGLLSGIGHPVIGFDHLLFVVLVGIIAFLGNHRLSAPLAYIVAMLIGCLVAVSGAVLPATEIIIGLSLLISGSLVVIGKSITTRSSLLLFALFGLFHGVAFGQAVAGQESGLNIPVLVGYLVGLGMVQYLIAIAAGRLVISPVNVATTASLKPRLAAAMVTGAGLLLTLENIEGALFGMLVG